MDIIWLNTESATDSQEVGSKAVGLARLARLNLPTPPGFVVSVSAFRKFLQTAGLAPQVASLAMCADVDELERRLQDVRADIHSATLPPDLQQSVTAAYCTLSGTVAVRSSGTIEDGEQSAFAGAYTSLLNRTGEAAVLDAIRECWTSAFSPSVAAYRTQHQLLGADWFMGVIVQTMVFADKAGVMFTTNPFTDDQTILIEAVSGGCEKIVSGTPAELSVWVDRASRKLRRVEQASQPARRFGTGAAGFLAGTATTLQPPRLLRSREIDTLVDAGLRLEAALGRPQDIEWAIVDGQLVLLQTRPLTAYSFHTETA
jgi:pyruvate,water dikinase